MGEGDCVFCRIIAGGIPSVRLLEDDAALAFMDIGPVAEGHALLIPKKHCATLDEMSAQDAAAVLGHLPALVKAVQSATGCAGVNILQNNGTAAGQVVPHVHFHIIPRDSDGAFQFNWPAGKYAPGRLEELAEAIRQALS